MQGLDLKSKGGKSKKHSKTSKEKDKSGEKASKTEKQANKQKKHKRYGYLLCNHFVPWAELYTVEPRLSVPRLSRFLYYPDFFSSPNFVMNIY